MIDIILITRSGRCKINFMSAGVIVHGPPVKHGPLVCGAPVAQLPAADGATAPLSDYNSLESQLLS